MTPSGLVLSLAGPIRKLTQSRQVVLSIGVVAFCSIGVKIAGMLRDIVLASKFGTSDAADAFIAAFLVPQFLAVIAGSAFVGAIIPLHAEARRNGGQAIARRFLSEMLLISIVVMGAITLLLVPLRDLLLPLVTSNFSPEKLAQTRELWLIMLPAVFLYALTTIWAGILNTDNKFGLAAASPVVVSICTIAALWFYPQGGVRSPAVGFVIGSLLQACWLLYGLHRHKMNVLPRWHGGLDVTRLAMHQFTPYLANGALFGSIGVVDQAMAATLGQGNLAVLSYGNKLVLPVLAIGSTALATVAYPRFSRLVAGQEWDRLHIEVKSFLGMILVATLPLMMGMVLFSRHIVELVFERGAFGSSDTLAVAKVQTIYALMIPAYTLSHMLSRVINALRATKLLLIGSIGIFTFNIVADYVFKEWIGVEGIALATVINYLLALAFNGYLFRRLIAERRAQSLDPAA